MNITTKQILNTTIQIDSCDIYKKININDLILNKLKQNEGKCTKNGYIVENSIDLINRSIGKIRNIDNRSLIEYHITYVVESILPSKGIKYDCIINNITKMGLICFIEFREKKDLKSSPLLIIIPKEYCDIEKQKEGQKITIETLDKRMKYMASQIQIIGKII